MSRREFAICAESIASPSSERGYEGHNPIRRRSIPNAPCRLDKCVANDSLPCAISSSAADDLRDLMSAIFQESPTPLEAGREPFLDRRAALHLSHAEVTSGRRWTAPQAGRCRRSTRRRSDDLEGYTRTLDPEEASGVFKSTSGTPALGLPRGRRAAGARIAEHLPPPEKSPWRRCCTRNRRFARSGAHPAKRSWCGRASAPRARAPSGEGAGTETA